MMDAQWRNYKQIEHPSDAFIYRTFKIDPLQFWNWGQYILDNKYRFPYLNYENLEKTE